MILLAILTYPKKVWCKISINSQLSKERKSVFVLVKELKKQVNDVFKDFEDVDVNQLIKTEQEIARLENIISNINLIKKDLFGRIAKKKN